MSLDLATLTAYGQRAFDAFTRAVETGDRDDWRAVLSPEVTFTVPLWFDDWLGEQHGVDRAAQIVDADRDTLGLRSHFTQHSIAASGNTVAVEFHNDGTNRGGAYHNRLCIVFHIADDGTVTRFSEYAGQLSISGMKAALDNPSREA